MQTWIGLALLLGVLVAPGCRATADTARSEASKAGEVRVGGSFLYFEEAGSGRTLVLIHGGQMDSRLWQPQVESLAPDYHVVTYDVRGFGRSGKVTDPYASHEDLTALIDALELDSVTLVGHSLGGRIAIDYALDHPERVQALVLVAPGVTGWNWSGPDHSFFGDIAAAAAAGDTRLAVELWLACPYMEPAMERADIAPRLRELTSANEHAWRIPPVEVRREPPATESLADLEMPTLLVVGDRDVPDILRIADMLQRELPNVRRVDLAGVGHVPSLESRERFDSELRRFLHATDE